MKIRHRVPSEALTVRPEPISERYQVEVDAAVAGAEKREREATRRLRVAEHRLAQVRASKTPRPRALSAALEILELRRQELLDIQRTMQSIPASSAHRSRAATRPVPAQRTL